MQSRSQEDHRINEGLPAVDGSKLIKCFGAVRALDGVSITIREGEFFSLLGPSGCGKTTLLRLIAGLEFPDSGQLNLLQRDVVGWPAYQRPVNTVFQSYALFPHMTVRENIGFGLRMKKLPRTEINNRVAEAARMVQIDDLMERFPKQLSGGQKQRVALARALVNEPKILLLDEPLGALDLKLRKQLQLELHQLQRRLGITFVYVTHDQEEALTMSDRVAVMNAGRIEQLGTPQELYNKPRNRFVAEFLGSCNLMEGTCVDGNVFELPCGTFVANEANGILGHRAMFAVRPEKIVLLRDVVNPVLPNHLRSIVEDVIFSGAETHYLLRAGRVGIRTCVFNSVAHEQFKAGDEVWVHVPPSALVMLHE